MIAGIVGWGIILTLVCLPHWRAALPFLTAIALIAAHHHGYKIYGSIVLVDNRSSFPEGFQIDYLEVPNVVIATDGSRHPLRGISFPTYLEKLSPADQRKLFANHGTTFIPDATSQSGYASIVKFNSNCGTTFLPVPFPPRVPLYYRQDLVVEFQFVHLPQASTF